MPIHHDIMDNVKASRVRMVAELSVRKARKKTGRFLVEGPQSVREALRFSSRDVVDIYVRSDYASSAVLHDLIEQAVSEDVYVHVATDAVMNAMSADCQGILAVVRTHSVLERSADAMNNDNASLIAACWQLRDPGNAGTIIRAADASGCEAVILVGECVDITNPKVVRSSAGSLFHVPVVYMTEEEFFEWTRQRDMPVTAADVYGTERTPVIPLDAAIAQTDIKRKHVILFGNEARGLETELVDASSRAVVIPLYGNAESLNVAMSASIMLYAFAMAMHA